MGVRRGNDEMLTKNMVVCSSLMGSREGECSKETTDHIFKSERVSCIGVAGVLYRRGNSLHRGNHLIPTGTLLLAVPRPSPAEELAHPKSNDTESWSL